MSDVDAVTENEALSILDSLGALRETRVSETVKSLAIPGTGGRLWATYRLPDGARVTQTSAMLASGAKQGMSTANNLLADYCTALFLAHGEDEDGGPVDRREFPGCDDLLPMALDVRLEATAPRLCPPRPGGKEHTKATRIRAVIGSDALLCGHALAVCAWALGGADDKGALDVLSERFVGES